MKRFLPLPILVIFLKSILFSQQNSWPMFHYDKENTGLSRLHGEISYYQIKWTVQLSRIDAGPVAEDLDNDGKIEVIIGQPLNPQIACINGEDGSILWQFINPPYGVYTECAIADFDQDGKKEVFVPSRGYKVCCLEGENGSILWECAVDDYIISSANYADLDGDGKLEIVFGGWQNGNFTYCLNGEDGSILWKVQTGYGVRVSPAIADIDGDGKLEVISASQNGPIYAINGEDGSVLWTYQISNEYWITAPSIGDLNNDGNLEIVFGDWYGRIFCLSNTGSLLWTNQVGDNIRFVYGAPAIGDIDQDGLSEVIIGSESYITGVPSGLHAFKGINGSLIWTAGLGLDFNSAPALCDINGDGYLEIIAGTDQNYVYCVNRYGAQLWVFYADSSVNSSPAIVDLDDDGKAEVVFGSKKGKVYALDEVVNIREKQINFETPFKNFDLNKFDIFDLSGKKRNGEKLINGIFILKKERKHYKFIKIGG